MKHIISQRISKSSFLLAAIVLAGNVGCTTKEKVIEEPATYTVNVNPNQKVDELVDAGEQLMSPYTFMLADSAFNAALLKDPNNKKAQFYKLLLRPWMLDRGMAVRVKPLYEKYNTLEKYNYEISRFPESPIKRFYLDNSSGEPLVSTAADIQNEVAKKRDAYIELYKFLKQHQDFSFEINLNPHIFEQHLKKEAANNCQYEVERQTVTCDYREVGIVKLNSADLVGLTQMVSGTILYHILYTSYSAEGFEKIEKQLQEPNLDPEAAQAILESQPQLGVLKADHKINLIENFGADYSAAIKWALKNQDSLCPLGKNAGNQRKGYLFTNGICVDNSTEVHDSLAKLDDALSGPLEVDVDKNNTKEKTTLNIIGVIRNPVHDLRSLAPASYKVCGPEGKKIAASMKDQTLGGLFVNGDAEHFMIQDCAN